MLEQSLCTTHFLHEAYHSLPTLGNTRNTSVLHVGVTFKQQKLAPPPQKKKTKTQQHGLKKTRDICLQNELKVRTSAGQLQLSSLSMSADEHENAAGVDLGITNTF